MTDIFLIIIACTPMVALVSTIVYKAVKDDD